MTQIILSLNCGSSSAKYQVYDWTNKTILAKGVVERVTVGGSFIKHEIPGREDYVEQHECPNHKEALSLIISILTREQHGVVRDIAEINAVGHRVVHGGEKFAKSVLISPDVLQAFRDLCPLAPLHNPPNVQGIEAAMEVLPQVPHVAVMDTAFLQTMPPASYTYAVPYEWYEKHGVRRYGFHGTSHLYVSKRASVLIGKPPSQCNLITCHIGNGVSFTAIKDGVAFDHSMGLTPLEGLVMGTRSGDIDPAIIPYIAVKTGQSVAAVENILNKKSGLVGITGTYTDRRDILKAAAAGDKRAQLAFDIECYRVRKYIGAYYAALGRLDAIVFTAGVGEMSPEIRGRALENLEQLGIEIDPTRNQEARTRNHESLISKDSSRVKVFVIPTDEEYVFTADVVAILEGNYDVHTKFKYSFESPEYVNKMREEAYKKELEAKKKTS
ncbi:MAG: acetate kinase [Candidatus Riflebacteria bacterium]|nr:acetate kinase [Candidatus Riflebacteria bacterium]